MGSRRGDTDRSTQCPQPNLPCAFPKGWFTIKPALTVLHPFPHLSGSLSRTQCRAPARQTNRPNLSLPAQWHLGALPRTERWETQKRRFARKARPLVSESKQTQNCQKGAEMQVTEETRPPGPEDFRSSHCTQAHKTLANRCTPTRTKECAGIPSATSPSRHFIPQPLRRRSPGPSTPPFQVAIWRPRLPLSR